MEETTTFPLIGEPLAVDLANTLLEREEGSEDLLATPERLSAWCQAEGERLGVVLDPAGLGGRLPEFLVLRGAIRELFRGLLDGERPSEGAVEEINTASARVPRFRELRWETEDRRGGLRAQTRDLGGEEADIALARIARSAIELAGDPGREFLRSCPAPGCPLIFCAENRRRRWCSNVCGNRVRVARHYRRHD